MSKNDLDEFYQGKEYKETKEYKDIPPFNYNVKEIEKFPDEEYLPEEIKLKGTNANAEEDPLETKNKGKLKNQIERLSSATSQMVHTVVTSTAAVVTTAVAIVAVATNITIPTPVTKLIELNVGCDYVAYDLDIQNLDKNLDYKIVIENPSMSYEVKAEEGQNKAIVNDLKPLNAYSLSLRGSNGEIGGYTTYFERSFYTIRDTSPSALLEIEEVKITDGDYIGKALKCQVLISDYNNVSDNYYLGVYANDEVYFYTELLKEEIAMPDINNTLPEENHDDKIYEEYIFELLSDDYQFKVFASQNGELIEIGNKNYRYNMSYYNTINYTYHTDYLSIIEMYGQVDCDPNEVNNSVTINLYSFGENDKVLDTISTSVRFDETGYFETEIIKHPNTKTFYYDVILNYIDSNNQEKQEIYSSERITSVTDYQATYSFIEPENTSITWNDDNTCNILVPINFITAQRDLYYKISLIDESGLSVKELVANDNQANFENVPTDKNLFIKYQTFAEFSDKTIEVYEEYQTTSCIDFTTPTVELNTLTPKSDNTFLVDFNISDPSSSIVACDKAIVTVHYLNSSTEEIEVILESDENFSFSLNNFVGESVTLSIDLFYYSVYGNNLRVKTYDNIFLTKEYQVITERVNVVNDNNYSMHTVEFINAVCLPAGGYYTIGYNDVVSDPLTVNTYEFKDLSVETYIFTIRLYNEQDILIGTNDEIVLDMATEVSANKTDYNPRNVLITYNDDETINIYYDCQFSSNDLDTYFEMILFYYDEDGNQVVQDIFTQEEMLIIPNLPFRAYYFYTYATKIIENVYYRTNLWHGSGGIEFGEEYIDITVERDETQTTINGNFSMFTNGEAQAIVTFEDDTTVERTIILTDNNYDFSIVLEGTKRIKSIDISYYYNQFDNNLGVIKAKLEAKGIPILGSETKYYHISLTGIE